MANLIDHKVLAISRLVTQFRESTNLIKYIESLLIESNNLEAVFQSLLEERWIETAIGQQLDVLGIIVGQPRILVDADIFSYFGFAINPTSKSFGTITNASIGGEFRGINTLTEGNRVLTDDEYRLFIKARIIKNISRSTPEDIIKQLQFLFDTSQVIFMDGDTEYTISIGSELTPNDRALLFDTDIVAKTAGVRINYLAQYDYDDFFAFQGVPNSLGFGSVLDSTIGGKLGSLI